MLTRMRRSPITETAVTDDPIVVELARLVLLLSPEDRLTLLVVTERLAATQARTG